MIPLYKEDRLIISLYDYTGEWAKPYIDAGYPVILWDYKVEGDILEGFSWLLIKIEEAQEAGYFPYGVLSAPPCTDFSSAGAQYWPEKDNAPTLENDVWNGVDYSVAYVEIVLHLVSLIKPTFWVMENPPGRLEKKVPVLKPFRKLIFSPYHFGDPYTKKTILWGQFNANLKRNEVKPEVVRIKAGGTKNPRYYNGSHLWAKTGGGSEKNKALRSKTPAGFAKAFFEANQ